MYVRHEHSVSLVHEVTANDLLTLIEQRAPALRAAGVRYVEIDGNRVTIRLAPAQTPDPVAQAVTTTPELPAEVEASDPLDDPATFGGDLPGYEFDPDPNEDA